MQLKFSKLKSFQKAKSFAAQLNAFHIILHVIFNLSVLCFLVTARTNQNPFPNHIEQEWLHEKIPKCFLI